MINYHLPLLNTSEAILVLSEDLRIEFANPAALRMLGFANKVPQDLYLQHVIEESGAAQAESIEHCLLLQGHWNGDVLLCRMGALPLPVRLVVDRYHDTNGVRHACIMSDISERKQIEKHLIQLSQLDSLTGLYNRSHFMNELEASLRLTRREGQQYALLFVDVDDLKKINDTLGHHIGDLCLCEVAQRLLLAVRRSPQTRSEPLVARIGGDEFVVLLSIASCSEALYVASGINSLMNVPWYPDDQCELNISTSIGIAYAPMHGRTSQKLLQLADRAMYHAKGSRKGSVHEFIQQLHPQDALRLETGFDSMPAED